MKHFYTWLMAIMGLLVLLELNVLTVTAGLDI